MKTTNKINYVSMLLNSSKIYLEDSKTYDRLNNDDRILKIGPVMVAL